MKKFLLKIFYIFTLFPIFTSSLYATIYESGTKEFELINPADTRNIIGNTQIIGNTVECVTSSFRVTSSDYSSLDCSNDLDKNDNNYIVKYIDIDSDLTTFNSSTATLQLPNTYKEIAWAGLYWQGHINNYSYYSSTTNDTYNSDPYNGWDYYYLYESYEYNVGLNYNGSNDFTDNDIKKTTANSIKLKIGSSSYTTVTADNLNYLNSSRPIGNTKYGAVYSSFADVTNYFTTYAAGDSVDITVANVMTTEGLERSLGNYGAWTLVVIYKENENNSASKLRNNSVYLGYKQVSSDNSTDATAVSIVLNDFLLPKNGSIDSSMAVFAAEGEYAYSPDYMSLDTTDLGDPDLNNVFDARLSSSITRNPSLTNNNGIDIDVFDTSIIMEDKRDANPSATSYSATIRLKSEGDLYLPSMVSFTTELYKPRVCYYINTIKNSSGTNIFENGQFVEGESITLDEDYDFDFFIANMKKDPTDPAIEIATLVQVYLKMTNFNYTSGSTYLNNTDESAYFLLSDSIDSDKGEYDNNSSTWRVGDTADGTQGGTLYEAVGFSDIGNIAQIKMRGSFSADSNTTEIDLLDYLEFKASFQTESIFIGADNAQLISQCQDLNTSGGVSSLLGAFNVVNPLGGTSAFDDPSSPQTWLSTQVADRTFDAKIISVDSTGTGLLSYTGDINISIIEYPYSACSDTDTVCKQNACDSATPINTPIPVTFNGTEIIQSFVSSVATKSAMFKIDYNNGDNHACSVDSFAIRPDTFTLIAPTGEDIELLKSGATHLMTLVATQDASPTETTGYTIANVDSSVFSILGDKYKPDGTLDNTLNGTFSFASTAFNIVDGVSDDGAGNNDIAGISFDDVGMVNIQLEDRTWAQIDIDNGDTVADCSSAGAYICGDINATFIPDHFKLSDVTLDNFSDSTFTYLSNDLNISAGIDVTVTAENGAATPATTQNFKDNSWEHDVSATFTVAAVAGMTLNKNEMATEVNLDFTNGVNTINSNETNTSKNIVFNYARTTNAPKNPFQVSGAGINVTVSAIYTAPTSGNTATITGTNVAIDNATFVYGRSHAPRQRFVGNSGTAFIYYENYCAGTGCDKSLLPNGAASVSTDDPRWFINTTYIGAPGNVGTINQKGGGGDVTAGAAVNPPAAVNAPPTSVVLTYNGTAYPFKTTMENNASTWLRYDMYKADPVLVNEFQVEFTDNSNTWAGVHETNTTTGVNSSDKTNRRTMW